MVQSLTVNGKKYVPSSVLAAVHSYTPDYIAKLAREEKILATQVGRQWFVEPASLETFLHQVAVEKNLRKEELSRKRKIEHSLYQKQQETLRVPSPLPALAQTALVAFCGLFLGGIGWVAFDAQLDGKDLARGAEETMQSLASGIFHIQFFEEGNIQVAASVESTSASRTSSSSDFNSQRTFAELPQFPVREQLASSAPVVHVANTLSDQFSDEVVVSRTVEGDEFVVPVFRSGYGENSFLIVRNPEDNTRYAQ